MEETYELPHIDRSPCLWREMTIDIEVQIDYSSHTADAEISYQSDALMWRMLSARLINRAFAPMTQHWDYDDGDMMTPEDATFHWRRAAPNDAPISPQWARVVMTLMPIASSVARGWRWSLMSWSLCFERTPIPLFASDFADYWGQAASYAHDAPASPPRFDELHSRLFRI